jgi:hypothetical protein
MELICSSNSSTTPGQGRAPCTPVGVRVTVLGRSPDRHSKTRTVSVGSFTRGAGNTGFGQVFAFLLGLLVLRVSVLANNKCSLQPPALIPQAFNKWNMHRNVLHSLWVRDVLAPCRVARHVTQCRAQRLHGILRWVLGRRDADTLGGRPHAGHLLRGVGTDTILVPVQSISQAMRYTDVSVKLQCSQLGILLLP